MTPSPPLPSKMGLGKNFGKKSVGQGQKIFDFTGGLCYGRSIFPGGDQMIFLENGKLHHHSIKNNNFYLL